MNCSFCANAALAPASSTTPSRADLIAFMFVLLRSGCAVEMIPPPGRRHACCNAKSVGKRPQAELFLRDLPEPREAMRLDDQEEDDEPAEDHQLEIRDRALGDAQMQARIQEAYGHREHDGDQRDERAS